MNLNPLENEKCLYDIEEIYEICVEDFEDEDDKRSFVFLDKKKT